MNEREVLFLKVNNINMRELKGNNQSLDSFCHAFLFHLNNFFSIETLFWGQWTKENNNKREWKKKKIKLKKCEQVKKGSAAATAAYAQE